MSDTEQQAIVASFLDPSGAQVRCPSPGTVLKGKTDSDPATLGLGSAKQRQEVYVPQRKRTLSVREDLRTALVPTRIRSCSLDGRHRHSQDAAGSTYCRVRHADGSGGRGQGGRGFGGLHDQHWILGDWKDTVSPPTRSLISVSSRRQGSRMAARWRSITTTGQRSLLHGDVPVHEPLERPPRLDADDVLQVP